MLKSRIVVRSSTIKPMTELEIVKKDFSMKIHKISSQDIFAQRGDVVEQVMSSGWDYNGLLDAEGRRSFGDNGLHLCPTLVSNPSEGLVTPYGYNEVGAETWWGGQMEEYFAMDGNGNYYYFNGPGNMAQMDPGVPYGRNYYTRGSNIYNIQDNKILKSWF